AAFGLLLPSFAMMVMIGVFDEALSTSPSWKIAMLGMQAGALGLITGSLKGLFWSQRKRILFWLLMAIAFFPLVIFPAWEPVLIIGSGLLALALVRMRPTPAAMFSFAFVPFLVGDPNSAILQNASRAQVAWDLFISCFKAGAFVFGSGL